MYRVYIVILAMLSVILMGCKKHDPNEAFNSKENEENGVCETCPIAYYNPVIKSINESICNNFTLMQEGSFEAGDLIVHSQDGLYEINAIGTVGTGSSGIGGFVGTVGFVNHFVG